ncbi:YrhC family protein [Heyndrickxia sporothermodurans]
MSKAKILYEKMNDYKRFAVISLALSAFLYLGFVIPMDGRTINKTYTLMIGTVLLLAISVRFFIIANRCRKILLDSEEGQKYLTKK